MWPKITQYLRILPNFLRKSKILKSVILVLVVFAILPQNSSQQETVNQLNIIETHCILSYDPQGRYNCYLYNIRTNSSTDVLEIVGEHLLNHTDADVDGVIHVDSMIHTFNGEVLRKFPNLKRLQLTNTYLQSINPNAFDVCGQLEEVDIGNTILTELPPQMLKNCGNLKVFLALSSRFSTINDDLFGNTRNLEVFNAANGLLMLIPDNLFQNMTNLKSFIVRSCQLTQLSPNNFINAINLEEMDITWNQFNNSQAVMDILNGHLGLKRIVISYNQFTMFNLSFFEQFQNLEDLSFGGNQNLTGIEWQFLPNSLQILRVFPIGEEIPENAFVKLSNLTFLDLRGYGITVLQKDTFSALTNLDRLDIMETRLTTLHPQLFRSQGKLRALQLSFNQIEELPEGVFAPLGNLGYNESVHGLFMIQNKVRRLSTSSFGQHPHLRYIVFAYNQIDKIQRGLFSRFNPVPALADFSRNECIDWGFTNEGNLDEHKSLEWCFNNYEGITTTTPNGTETRFKIFEIYLIVLVGFVKILINF